MIKNELGWTTERINTATVSNTIFLIECIVIFLFFIATFVTRWNCVVG